MTFEEAYRSLKEESRLRVKKDNEEFCSESIFLPNRMPAGPVDYVLVGMEPSLAGWAKDLDDAQKKINEGFRNFDGVWILRDPVENFLLRDGETYYLTDLAQGAMRVGDPGAGKPEKYEKWFRLFEKEIGLVAKPDALIISIGNRVGQFLNEKALYGHIGSITHYSRRAAAHWGKEIPGREDEFKEFTETLPEFSKKSEVSESEKKLLFDYKIRFEHIRAQPDFGWRYWQQEWQQRLTQA